MRNIYIILAIQVKIENYEGEYPQSYTVWWYLPLNGWNAMHVFFRYSLRFLGMTQNFQVFLVSKLCHDDREVWCNGSFNLVGLHHDVQNCETILDWVFDLI